MEFFKQNTKINFMAQRKWAALFSIILFLGSITALAVNGLNWGLDFTGGTQLTVHFEKAPNLNQLRQDLHKVGYQDVEVISYGTSKDVLISVSGEKNQTSAQHEDTKDKIEQALPESHVQSVDYIGPQIGKELAQKGVLAMFLAIVGTMIYVAMRFEYRFAIGSTIALIHDPMLILGIFAYFHLEFDLIALAALLTVIGYSLNDTVVIFDRVRENFRRHRKMSAEEIVNLSTNQTLSRTIMTSLLTLLVVTALFFLGGAMIHGFALALIIGIVVGTYSSIYVAGSLALVLGLKRESLLPPNVQVMDDRP